MSVLVSTAVWRESDSRGSARLVLLALADEANDDGFVTAYRRSQSHLAMKARCNQGTVRRAIGDLETLGELVVLQTGTGRESSDYRIDLPSIEGARDRPPQRAPRERETRAEGARDARPLKDPLSPVTPVDDSLRSSSPRQIPNPFLVDDEMKAWSADELPGFDWRNETKAFVDHWRGNGKRKVDWRATWRNWMRRSARENRPGRGGKFPTPTERTIDNLTELLEEGGQNGNGRSGRNLDRGAERGLPT